MRASWIAGVLCVASCAPKAANAPTPAQQAQTVEVAKPATSAAPAPAKGPLPRVLAVVRPDSTFVLYLDGDTLRAAPWFHAVVASVPAALGGVDPLGMAEKRCGLDPSTMLKRLAVAGSIEPVHIVTLAELTRPASDVLSCIQKFWPDSKKTRVGEHDVLTLDEYDELAGSGRFLVYGPKWDIDSFDFERSPGPLPAFAASALSAHREATLVGAMDLPHAKMPVKSAQLVMQSDQSHWSLRTDLETKTPELADKVAKRISALSAAASSGVSLPDLHASVHDSHVSLQLGVAGDGAAQAVTVSALVYVALSPVRNRIAWNKAEEARTTVYQIAKDIASYCSRLPTGKVLIPPSAPLTPATVPRGTKYQSTSGDWNRGTWKKIKFQMTSPQYYSYEIVTADDRKSAVVRATGDLDGDGKASHFSISIEVENGKAVIAPNINEEDPDE